MLSTNWSVIVEVIFGMDESMDTEPEGVDFVGNQCATKIAQLVEH